MEKPRNLDPNPSFTTQEIKSTELDEPFIWLTARAIDTLTIDGHKLLSVDSVAHVQNGTTHIVCTAEDGTSHLFAYDSYEESTISHSII